jgi:pimeloyl-ACP methyl ester carboxylesterase
MYQRAPKSPETVSTSSHPELSFAEQQRLAKRHKLLATIALILTPPAALSTYHATDVSINIAREKAAIISIETQPPTGLEYGGPTATFVDGYGSMNATYLARKFGTAVQRITEGPVQSVNFSDAPIDAGALAKRIVMNATIHETDKKSFYGFSAGGILATEAAEKIITDETNQVQVETLLLAATPSGPESLREGQVENIQALNFLVDSVPEGAHSSMVTMAIKMAADHDQYANGGPAAFFKVWQSNLKEIKERSEPGARQLDDQTVAIMNANFEQYFANIAGMRGKKQMPVVVYLAAADPNADTTVDNDEASKRICEAARKHGIRCVILKVPGAVHSIYAIDPASYEQALLDGKRIIDPLVTEERISYMNAQLPATPYITSYRPQ